MTKEQALKKTKERFTNLIDGRVKPGMSVYSIINYYEELLADKKTSYKQPAGGIEQNFMEDMHNEMLDDEENDFYYTHSL